MDLDHFENNLLLAMDHFAPLRLLIRPKDVYHDHEKGKSHVFELEDKVIRYIHKYLFVESTSFKLDPSVAVINYWRTVNDSGQYEIAESCANRDPSNTILPPVKSSAFRFLTEYNSIPHSFELFFFGKIPLVEDGSFMDGEASYWKIDEKRII